MKLSHKLVMVSAAVLMGVSPLVGASQAVVEAAPKKTTTSAKSKGTIVLGRNAYVYFANGKRNKNYKFDGKTWPVIGKGASLKTAGLKTINGVDYYDIGGGNYIKAANVATLNGKKVTASTSSTTKVKTVKLTKNAYVYSKTGVRIKSAATLKKGTTIKYYGTKTIKGKQYFALANNQFVKTANAKVATEEVQDDMTMINIVKNSIIYDGNGSAYEPKQKIIKGAQYVALKAKQIDGKWYYMIGNSDAGEQWIKAVNTTLASGKALIPDTTTPDNVSQDDVDADSTIAILSQKTNTYDGNGVATSNTFNAGQRLRVSSLRYIWVASENKAELFYELSSAPKGYFIKQSAVSSISGKPLNATNTADEARLSGVVATANDKANLNTAIKDSATVKASDSYKLSAKTARDAYDAAITAGQVAANSDKSSLLQVNNALSTINNAKAALNGAKIKVASLASLTTSEADQIINLAATVNGVATSQVQFANNNQNLIITQSNGLVQTLNVSDYAG